MFRYAALLGMMMILNPIVAVNSEPLQLNENISLEYETTNNQSELVAQSPAKIPGSGKTSLEVYDVCVTGYSSTPDQTDDTPFITASGTHVRPGVVAANFLPIGTKIKIPELFGDQIFVIEDRMNKKNSNNVDVWFSERESAKTFGKNYTKIIVM